MDYHIDEKDTPLTPLKRGNRSQTCPKEQGKR